MATWVGLRRVLREVRSALLSEISPRRCAACGSQTERGLCAACLRRLERRARPWCERCGTPFGANRACPLDHRGLRGIRIARAPFLYVGTGGDLVRAAKFRSEPAAFALLAAAMASCVKDWRAGRGRRSVVVSVPLHRRKRRRRGFDQSALLAERVAQRLGLASAVGVLGRLVDTLPQGDVRVTSRERNVSEVFDVRRESVVRGRCVLLVDDVTTSGATARECARVLLEAGAQEVALVTATVAPRDAT